MTDGRIVRPLRRNEAVIVALLGDYYSGKTSLVRRYWDDSFFESTSPGPTAPIGKKMEIEGVEFSISLCGLLMLFIVL